MRSGKWGVSFSSEETAPACKVARKVGGYDELLRLEKELREHQKACNKVKLVVDSNGKYQFKVI